MSTSIKNSLSFVKLIRYLAYPGVLHLLFVFEMVIMIVTLIKTLNNYVVKDVDKNHKYDLIALDFAFMIVLVKKIYYSCKFQEHQPLHVLIFTCSYHYIRLRAIVKYRMYSILFF